MKKVLPFLAGLIIASLCLTGLAAGSSMTGYTSIQFTTPTPNNVARIFPTMVTATTQVTSTPSFTATPRFTPTSTMTLTPEITATEVPSCMTHINGVAIKISMTETDFIVKSTHPCLMMSTGNFSVGKPEIGELVEVDEDHKETINFKQYTKYYVFTIPINPDRVAAKGIYMESAEHVHWEIEASDFGNFYWLDEHYAYGDYWFLMKFVTDAEETATAGA